MSKQMTNSTGAVEEQNVNIDINKPKEVPIQFQARNQHAVVQFYPSTYVMQYWINHTQEFVPYVDLEDGKNTHGWWILINGVISDYWSAEKGLFIDEARQILHEHPEASLEELTGRLKKEARTIHVESPSEDHLKALRLHRYKTGDDRDPAIVLMIANFDRAMEMITEYVEARDERNTYYSRPKWMRHLRVEWIVSPDGTPKLSGFFIEEEEQDANPEQTFFIEEEKQEATSEQRLAIEFADEEERVRKQGGETEET